MNPKLWRQIVSTTSITRCEFPSKLGRLLEKPPPIPGHAAPGNRDNWVASEFPQLLISALFLPKFSRMSILWSAQLCFRGKKLSLGHQWMSVAPLGAEATTGIYLTGWWFLSAVMFAPQKNEI